MIRRKFFASLAALFGTAATAKPYSGNYGMWSGRLLAGLRKPAPGVLSRQLPPSKLVFRHDGHRWSEIEWEEMRPDDRVIMTVLHDGKLVLTPYQVKIIVPAADPGIMAWPLALTIGVTEHPQRNS